MEFSVRDRYSAAALEREAALCCPVNYNPEYLRVIPQEVIERDYGCGDPSRYVREGDVVLDLGSGGGKICFIAAQITGPKGRVIGVDMNPDMLALARRSAPLVAGKLGYSNVEFRRGRIQDLQLDLDRADARLRDRPIADTAALAEYETSCAEQREREPLIASDSIDVVVSNCVLNLVRSEDKPALIREIFRVLRRGGRIAISDIVSDEVVPPELQQDAELWSGCISGAFHERELLDELERAGFHGIAVSSWEQTPFRTVQGIEFRSVTVTAYKGKQGPCYEANQAVIYRGPWKQVEDDDGHILRRGERVAVCAKTFDLYTSAPYQQDIIAIEPREAIPEAERAEFDCSRTHQRHPRETKGLEYDTTSAAAESCCAPGTGSGSGCC